MIDSTGRVLGNLRLPSHLSLTDLKHLALQLIRASRRFTAPPTKPSRRAAGLEHRRRALAVALIAHLKSIEERCP